MGNEEKRELIERLRKNIFEYGESIEIAYAMDQAATALEDTLGGMNEGMPEGDE